MDDIYRRQELAALGRMTLRRDGWRRVGEFWVRGLEDNEVPDSRSWRYAERPPMNRRRRRRRRRGLDRIPSGHTMMERKLVRMRVDMHRSLDRLAMYPAPTVGLSGFVHDPPYGPDRVGTSHE